MIYESPMIEVETASGVREIKLTTKELSNRRIFIQGEIDNDLAMSVVQQIMYLQKESNEPITIYISSPGGSVMDGLLIYDAIEMCPCIVKTVVLGMAASMGAVLFASGTKGERYMCPHSKVMIHEPLISNGVGGSATSIKNISESILETKKILNTILAKHCNKSIKELNKATSYDNYMNIEEAMKFGICDKTLESLFV
jgi:ATP-dependent Clp protease protease subunit